MKTYTEQDLRNAFKAGEYKSWYSDNSTSYEDKEPLDEDEYINSLKETVV